MIKWKQNTIFKPVACFLILCLSLFIFPTKITYAENPPSAAADSVVLLDATTGEILYSRNMNTAYPPASTTKVMTALLTLENCDLDEIVTIPEKAVGIEGSKIWILKDEDITVRNLLLALMLESANDCAVALAIHVGGSEEAFVKMMNDKAKELGLKNTNFENPHGLYNNKHKTSAYDLAQIMREAVKYPEFVKISTTVSAKVPGTTQVPKGHPLWNKNKLVQGGNLHYKYIESGKTGYTTQSQHSYVASAQKDGQRLIVALVHDEIKNYFYDAIELFNYGFDNYKLEKIYSAGETITTYEDEGISMPLIAKDDVYMTLKKDSSAKPELTLADIDKNSVYIYGDEVTTGTAKIGKSTVDITLLAGDEYFPPTAKINKTYVEKTTAETQSTPQYPVYPFVITVLIIIMLIVITRIIQIKKKSRKKNIFWD
ncbi:D-alanyl-D-alanine carboxypeptidase family protein [Oceanirhabdus sp. W0125-5]|uniref:D-alanyl-D-alanine carboxypeptidase family protein n=1 Tax=Oceanirhabdus sp. W0125-5 TaxID=2999116 RepID=UPI0022F3471A|nr:D-alanyl-D-alanine carboxypeptidase family protein [Oceanirhabdus sp. W0125-5]WBW95834.1 D-alanyl-D-alanine carboxypeptidase [Oceanirhabdus sp. W0125-5]